MGFVKGNRLKNRIGARFIHAVSLQLLEEDENPLVVFLNATHCISACIYMSIRAWHISDIKRNQQRERAPLRRHKASAPRAETLHTEHRQASGHRKGDPGGNHGWTREPALLMGTGLVIPGRHLGYPLHYRQFDWKGKQHGEYQQERRVGFQGRCIQLTFLVDNEAHLKQSEFSWDIVLLGISM